MADSAAPSWIEALPSVADHPAASGGTPAAPAAVVAAPAAATGWIDSMPSVTDHPAAMAPPTPTPAAPEHPVAGPSGDLMTDAGRRLGTAGTDVLGGVLGLPSAAAHAVDWAGRKIGVDVGAQPALSSIQQPGGGSLFPTPEAAREMAYKTTGATEYQPETAAGRIGQMALTGAMSAPLGGAASLRGMAAAIPGNTAGGALAGAVREVAPDSVPAQIAGAVIGAKAGNKLANVGTSIAGLRTPAGGPLSPQVAQLAHEAQYHGIPIAPAQMSGNWLLRNMQDMGSKLPFSGADAFADAQREAWTRAVSRQFGEDAPRITPEVLNDARARIGGVFNGVASRTAIPMSNQFMTDLQRVVNNSRLTMSADSVVPVERQAMNIVDTAANNGGDIGGRAYIDLTAKGGPLDTMMQSTDSGLRQAGIQLRRVIDDHLAQNASPGDVPMLQQARSQWKAMKTVEPLTTRADTVGGATPSTGDISPAALRSAVNKSYKRTAGDVLGQNPMTDLAKIGQRFLKEPKSSGTAERNMTRDIAETGGSLVAGLVGAHETGISPLYTVAPTAAAIIANRGAQSVMRNPWLARQQIAGSLNPNGFSFQSRIPVPALPFSWGAYGSNSIPGTP